MEFKVDFDKFVIPPCPWIITGLLRESRKEEPDMARICALISHDPALTVSILQAVNSPVFGYAKKLAEVRDAVFALGLNRTMSLALACKVQDLGGQHKDVTAVWDHSRKVAEVSAKLFKLCYMTEFTADAAYTAGLLHDVGIFLLLGRDGYSSGALEIDLGKGAAASNHAELGALVLEKWGLPPVVYQTARYHHQLEGLSADVPVAVAYMAAIVHLAERIEDLMKFPFDGRENELSERCSRALEILSIPVEEFDDFQYKVLESLE